MHRKYLTLLGLKFNPFVPDLPSEALWRPPRAEHFGFRVAQQVRDGGFAMLSGDVGLGKSVVLRMLYDVLSKVPEVRVGIVSHPQSGLGDFYRELGDPFGVALHPHNRWSGFKTLRQRWQGHIEQSAYRPVLLIDEAQEMGPAVMGELKLLSSKDFDARPLLMVVFCGDVRLAERLSTPELMPMGSRIRTRLKLEPLPVESLAQCLDHVLLAAGNKDLFTPELKRLLCDHGLGNLRVLMNLCMEVVMLAASREQGPPLDEKLYFEAFPAPTSPRAPSRPRPRVS